MTDAAGSTIRRRDIAGFSLTEAVYAEGVSLPRHCHANSYLTLVLSGTYIETLRAIASFTGAKVRCIFCRPANATKIDFETATRLLRVKIEPSAIQQLGDEPRALPFGAAGNHRAVVGLARQSDDARVYVARRHRATGHGRRAARNAGRKRALVRRNAWIQRAGLAKTGARVAAGFLS